MTDEEKLRLEALRLAAQVMQGAIMDEKCDADGIGADTLDMARDFLRWIKSAKP